MSLIRRHPEMTERILASVPTFEAVARIAASHHERLDGTGYHRGVPAHRLGVAERVVAVADVYEALTADRPYRAGMDPEEAMRTIVAMGGRHLATDIIATLRDHVLADEVSVRVA
jgi:HD-GYP domain-containing protein (c-di-GMP phosphodiesterase class II)